MTSAVVAPACLVVTTGLLVLLTLQFSGPLLLAAGGSCALLLLVVVVLTHRDAAGRPLSPAALIVLALTLALLFAAAVNLRAGDGGFAFYGQTKELTLPAVLVMFGLFAVAVLSRSRRGLRLPTWWLALAVAVTVSSAASVLLVRQPLDPQAAAQGAALLIGVLLLSWLGLQADRWSDRETSALLAVLLGGALVSGLLATGLTPFGSLLIPGTFASLLLAVTHPRHRAVFLLLAVALGVLTVRRLRDLDAASAGGVSDAVVGEVVGCVLLLLLYVIPRALRPLAAVLAAVGGAVALVQSRIIDLLVGDWRGFSDPSLAHRGFETQQVLDLLVASPVSALVGLGPGGTVDLTGSPDAGTLAASGRVLSSVDDVHLLPGHVLLKLGVVGLVAVTLFAVALARLVLALLHEPSAWWDRAVLLFVAAGVVSSLPAATNLLTNPLVFLLSGVLIARWRARAAGRAGASSSPAVTPPDDFAGARSVTAPSSPRAA